VGLSSRAKASCVTSGTAAETPEIFRKSRLETPGLEDDGLDFFRRVVFYLAFSGFSGQIVRSPISQDKGHALTPESLPISFSQLPGHSNRNDTPEAILWDDLPESLKSKIKTTRLKNIQTIHPPAGVSRRDFTEISASPRPFRSLHRSAAFALDATAPHVQGPGKSPVSTECEWQEAQAQLEPRVTLLDALRDQFELSGRQACLPIAEPARCTVLLDGKAVYSCSVLAIRRRKGADHYCEGLGASRSVFIPFSRRLSTTSTAVADSVRRLRCSHKAFLDQHPNPTAGGRSKHGLGGKLCPLRDLCRNARRPCCSGKTKGA